MPKFNGTSNETFVIAGNKAKWTFGSSALISGEPYGIHGEMGSPRLTVNFNGTVFGENIGIYVEGSHARVNIGANGQVTGESGIYVGEHGKVVNRGTVICQSMAIVTEYDHVTTINHGDVIGAGGVFGGGDGARIVNGKNGRILASDVGVGHESDTKSRFINDGLVKSSNSAYEGEDGKDTIINRGRLVGDVFMEQGNDTVDNRRGTIQGAIYGDDGNDVLITSRAKDKLVELPGDGTDTVKSTVSYKLSDNVERLVLLGKKDIDGRGTAGADQLKGNAGDNMLVGFQGSDRLDGGKGNDILKGGLDADRFIFSTGYDKDTIAFFEPGVDDVDISGWKAINNLNQLKSHAQNHGQDVWIKAGDDILVIKGLNKGDLDAGDFLF